MVIIQLVDDSDYSPFWIFHRWRLHVDMIAKSCRFAYFCIFSLVGFQSIFNHSLNEWWFICISHWLRRFEHSFADSMLIQSTFRRVGYLTIHFQLEFAYSNTIWTGFFSKRIGYWCWQIMKHSSVELNFILPFGAHFSHLLVEVGSTTVVIYCLIRSKNLVKNSFINGINQTLVGVTEYGLCVYVSGFVRLISWVFDASTNGRTIIISSIEASNRQQSSFF